MVLNAATHYYCIVRQNTRNFFFKGQVILTSTRVPYFPQNFQYSCPIKCPLFWNHKRHIVLDFISGIHKTIWILLFLTTLKAYYRRIVSMPLISEVYAVFTAVWGLKNPPLTPSTTTVPYFCHHQYWVINMSLIFPKNFSTVPYWVSLKKKMTCTAAI